MSKLFNPYKREGLEVETRQIIASVGVEDWERCYMSVPFRGTQDAVFSSLFFTFMKSFRQTDIPNHYEPTNTRKIAALLSGTDIRGLD